MQTSEAILSMSNEIIRTMVEELLDHIPCLYVLSEIVSVIDMLQVTFFFSHFLGSGPCKGQSCVKWGNFVRRD